MKKQFQHLQALLGDRRLIPLRATLASSVLFFLAAVTALLSAQSPQPVAAPTSAPAEATNTPSLPEPTPPPLGDAAPPVAAPLPVSPPPLAPAPVSYQQTGSANANEPLVTTGRPVAGMSYGAEGNRKASQLLSMPPEPFTFDRALLRDVLRFLAEAAGIPFVSIPENSPLATQLVTMRMTASPFAVLQSLATGYGFNISYQNGVWFFSDAQLGGGLQRERLNNILRKRDENELISVLYQLRHEAGDRIEFRSDLQNPTGTTTSPQVIGAGVSTPNLPLQNSQKVFAEKLPRLVNDIRSMVGLPPLVIDEKTGQLKEDPDWSGGKILDADKLAIEAEKEMRGISPQQYSSTNQIPNPIGGIPVYSPGIFRNATSSLLPAEGSRDSDRPGGSGDGANKGFLQPQPDTVAPLYVPPQKPQVIYNAEQNFLWVVATRKQHKWVAEYLSKVDKPQDLIAIEVKFLETKKNPQIDIGINWENTFGKGLTVSGEARFGSMSNPIGAISYGNQSGTNAGTIVPSFDSEGNFENFNTATPGLIQNNFNSIAGQVPYSAVLSLDKFSATLNAFMQDRDTSIVQYPRVLTLNNREVAITSSENTPINVGTSAQTTASGAAASTVVGQLGYLPTGTQINILPKVIDKNRISMTVAITVSAVVGEIPLNLGTGFGSYPVTSERVYNASLQVDSGYTLAVGGLEKVSDKNTQGGIPVLKDIPGLGYLFKNKNKQRDRVNLIIFITPYLIGDPAKTPGISETPVSVVPQKPGVPPEAPAFAPDGKLAGGADAVPGALAWLEFQLRYFRQINLEALVNLETIRKLRDVIGVARALVSELQATAGDPPYDPDTTAGDNALRAEELLTELNQVLAVAQDNLM